MENVMDLEKKTILEDQVILESLETVSDMVKGN